MTLSLQEFRARIAATGFREELEHYIGMFYGEYADCGRSVKLDETRLQRFLDEEVERMTEEVYDRAENPDSLDLDALRSYFAVEGWGEPYWDVDASDELLVADVDNAEERYFEHDGKGYTLYWVGGPWADKNGRRHSDIWEGSDDYIIERWTPTSSPKPMREVFGGGAIYMEKVSSPEELHLGSYCVVAED